MFGTEPYFSGVFFFNVFVGAFLALLGFSHPLCVRQPEPAVDHAFVTEDAIENPLAGNAVPVSCLISESERLLYSRTDYCHVPSPVTAPTSILGTNYSASI